MQTSTWWQEAIFYQVYLHSFADSNGDGIGDLAGIIAKLEYLKYLGVDALWLSPHYPSPFVDCGYDIADYCAVGEEYGTLEDFGRLLDCAHMLGLRIVIDMVFNHTSDRHAWFEESRSGRDSARRDWYIWKDGKGDEPPNNWLSAFGGSAWEFDPASGQYYYHLFFKEQPDLNWHNPQVQQAMFEAVRFWLDLGVDGLRLDAIDTLFEDPRYLDHPVNRPIHELRSYLLSASSEQRAEDGIQHLLFQHQVDQPGCVEVMQRLRALVNQYDDRVLIGESDRVAFYGNGADALHMLFNFPLMNTKILTPALVRQNQRQRLSAIPAGGWAANTLGNHDRPRSIEAHGDGMHNLERARLSAALMLTLRGTPFLYNGEEIGMTNLYLHDASQIRDRVSLWVYQMEQERGTPPGEALIKAVRMGRDQCRTPMQWKNAPNAGFCLPGTTPWLPVNPNYAAGITVEDQIADANSLLQTYRQIIAVRKAHPALSLGLYRPLAEENTAVFAFLRSVEPAGERCVVALNFSESVQVLEPGLPEETRLRCLFSTHCRREQYVPGNRLYLAAWEGFIGGVEG